MKYNDRSTSTTGVTLAAILSVILLVSTPVIPAYADHTKILTVRAYTTDGKVLSMYVTIKSGSTTVKSGFTPLSYTGTTAKTYTTTVSDYQSLVFDRWGDGSTGNPRTITLGGDTTAAAYYKTGSSSSTGTSSTSTTTSTQTTDKFGLKMIYPTKNSGEQWFMNMASPTSDSRFNPKDTITLNSDGSWNIKSTKVRMNVFTSAGYHPERISTYNQQELAKKGYMQNSNDWKNVEITGFVKVNSTPSNDNFAWYARGGKHTDSNGGCEGTAYKGNLFYDGKVRFAKEQQHSDGYSFTSKVDATGSIKGKWIGFKTVMYNNAQGNVVLQTWINENADKVTWKKVAEKIDSGGWGSDGDMCGGSPDQKITWGGPITTFRWDTATNVDFKWLSVREIQPPA